MSIVDLQVSVFDASSYPPCPHAAPSFMREEREKQGARKGFPVPSPPLVSLGPRVLGLETHLVPLSQAPPSHEGSLARARVAVGRIACQTRDSIPSLRKLLTQPRARAEVCTVTLWAQCVSRRQRPEKALYPTARYSPTRRSLCGPSKAPSRALGRAGPTTLHRRPRACGESTPSALPLDKRCVVVSGLSSSPFAA